MKEKAEVLRGSGEIIEFGRNLNQVFRQALNKAVLFAKDFTSSLDLEVDLMSCFLGNYTVKIDVEGCVQELPFFDAWYLDWKLRLSV